MSDETTNLKPSVLFKELETVFKKIGFAKQQIVNMDITAGAYLVTNPTGDLPRVICTTNEKNELKIEYSQLTETNLKSFSFFMTNLRNNHMLLKEGQIIDTTTGSIIEDFEIEGENDFDYSQELTNMILETKELIKSMKFYLVFLITKASLLDIQADLETKAVKTENLEAKLQFEDDTALILDFISNRATKCVQSKHLLELYPKSTKSECFKKLKKLTEKGYLTQSGPWFLLPQRSQ